MINEIHDLIIPNEMNSGKESNLGESAHKGSGIVTLKKCPSIYLSQMGYEHAQILT